MPRSKVGRTVVAVLMGYVLYGVIVAVVEWIFLRQVTTPRAHVFDVVLHCAGAVLGGLVCTGAAEEPRWVAVAWLTGIGLLFKAIFALNAWNTEPHWYCIALLLVYAPCVWIGWALARKA